MPTADTEAQIAQRDAVRAALTALGFIMAMQLETSDGVRLGTMDGMPLAVSAGLLATPYNTSATVTGGSGSSHTYQVVAVCARGDSLPCATMPASTVATTNGSNYVTVAWSPVVGATGYRVLKDNLVISGANALPAGQSSFVDNAGVAGSAYTASTYPPFVPQLVSNDSSSPLYVQPPIVTPIDRVTFGTYTLTRNVAGSNAITATDLTTGTAGQGVGGFAELNVDILHTNISGTTPTISWVIERQNYNQGSNSWLPLAIVTPTFPSLSSSNFYHLALTIGAGVTDDPLTPTFVNLPGTTTYFAKVGIKVGLGDQLRILWIVGGTTPSFDVYMGWKGK